MLRTPLPHMEIGIRMPISVSPNLEEP